MSNQKLTLWAVISIALSLHGVPAWGQITDSWVCRVAAGSFGPSPYRTRIDEILRTGELPATPVSGHITSAFGWRTHPIYGTQNFHTGIDIAAPEGTPIYSSEAGVVEVANHGGAIGLQVTISHATHKTIYGHMSRIAVAPGQSIQQGDLIGYVGSTGDSTGPHLHFTVYEQQADGWQRIDPANYLAQSSSPQCQHLIQN